MYLQSGALVTFSTPVRSVRKGSKVEEWSVAPPSTHITRDILKKAHSILRTFPSNLPAHSPPLSTAFLDKKFLTRPKLILLPINYQKEWIKSLVFFRDSNITFEV